MTQMLDKVMDFMVLKECDIAFLTTAEWEVQKSGATMPKAIFPSASSTFSINLCRR